MNNCTLPWPSEQRINCEFCPVHEAKELNETDRFHGEIPIKRVWHL